MLIHASIRWTGVVTIHLWPYAMQMANQAYNASPLTSHTDKQSPTKSSIIQWLTSTRNTGNPFNAQLTYSNLNSKGPREYTQNGMPGLEPASTWGAIPDPQ